MAKVQFPRKRKRGERYGTTKINNTYIPSTNNDVINKVLDQISPRGLLVFIEDQTQSPATILQSAVGHANCSLKFKPVDSKCPTTWQCLINDEVFAEGITTSESKARGELSGLALKELQKYCFTIKRKYKLTEGPAVSLNKLVQEEPLEKPLPTFSGLGAKMMMKMGWKGGGLGAEEQGQQKLIEQYHQVDRQGLGTVNISNEINKILKDYAEKQSLTSLAFSSEFTLEERKQIHSMAKKHNLKSQSYGKGDNRMLVLSCKLSRWDMIHKLVDMGGECEQYKLIYPAEFPNNIS